MLPRISDSFHSSYDYSSLTVQQASQNGGILSKLALHFPHVFSFWGRHSQQQIGSGKEDAVSSHETSSYDIDEGENRVTPSIIDDRFGKYYAELEPDTSNNSSKLSTSRFPPHLTYVILHAGFLSFLVPFFKQILSILHDRDFEKNEDLFDTISNCPIVYESINDEGNFERQIITILCVGSLVHLIIFE